MSRYKPDEGRNTRQAAFWALTIFVSFGCYSLRGALDAFVGLRGSLLPIEKIPVIALVPSGSFFIALALFVGLMYLLVQWLGKPKTSDVLIEVEQELNKVTWPSFPEATTSSMAVVITVLVLGGFLAFSDWVLGQGVFRMILPWDHGGS